MTEDGDDDPDPFAESESLDDETDDADAGDDPDDDAPLADLAREVRKRREADESASTSKSTGTDLDSDPFESVDVAEVDDEAVWESFVEGSDEPEAGVGLGAEVHKASEANEHVVSKREFCQRCPHFSAPPATACTHEGTTIVEVVDADDFRVRNCPIVAERRESSID
ncbi:hypothetical protein [Haloplanus sp.]|uniref:hypothetical protein n=1 Tax=Haloplanus sp. TaxID=1961696 RepID=UPI0026355E41|nr:hypothetical protein [Haloplanus sp.]